MKSLPFRTCCRLTNVILETEHVVLTTCIVNLLYESIFHSITRKFYIMYYRKAFISYQSLRCMFYCMSDVVRLLFYYFNDADNVKYKLKKES